MADGQSSPPCGPLGLLLLLIGGICSVHAGPTDFWFKYDVRRNKMNEIKGLRADMVACVGADTLHSPVQLPCVMVHTAQWANKTLQQKCAEVVEALRMFRHGVQGQKNQSTSECQTSLLEKLEHHITSYVAIVCRLQIQLNTARRSTENESGAVATQNCSSVNSTMEVLKQFEKLLQGKLSLLAIDLQDKVPESGLRSTAAEGQTS